MPGQAKSSPMMPRSQGQPGHHFHWQGTGPISVSSNPAIRASHSQADEPGWVQLPYPDGTSAEQQAASAGDQAVGLMYQVTGADAAIRGWQMHKDRLWICR